MSEECENEDQELEAIHKQVGAWFDVFINSPQFELLTEGQKNKAPDIVRFFPNTVLPMNRVCKGDNIQPGENARAAVNKSAG